MRKVSGLMLGFVVILVMGTVAIAGDAKWFDMENCEMCKSMMETEGFMQNVTWETHPIGSGMIEIVGVAKGFEEKYAGAKTAMMANVEKLKAGEKMTLCGMCQAYGKAMDESVKTETIKTMTGEINLMTSGNPETVTKLQEIAKRNTKEMAAMMAGQGGHGDGGHEGHNH